MASAGFLHKFGERLFLVAVLMPEPIAYGCISFRILKPIPAATTTVAPTTTLRPILPSSLETAAQALFLDPYENIPVWACNERVF